MRLRSQSSDSRLFTGVNLSLALALALVALVLAPARTVGATTSGWVECAEVGGATVTWTASGPLSSRALVIDFHGAAVGCSSSDEAVHSAVEAAGHATGTLNCLNGFQATDSGVFTAEWNTGRKSVIAYTEHSRYGVGHSDGTVIEGEFNHLATANDDLEGGSPMMCVADSGTTSSGFNVGRLNIGSPSLSPSL